MTNDCVQYINIRETTMQLKDLKFSDIYISLNPENAGFKETTDSSSLKPIPLELYNEYRAIRNALDAEFNPAVKKKTSDTQFEWVGIKMRVERMETINEIVYVCRNWTNQTFTSLSELGFSLKIERALMSPIFRSGLILMMGSAGSGKTTASCTYVVQKLKTCGGVAWTLERPVERTIDGKHGNGRCYQVQVDTDADFAPWIERIVRAAPNILMIGEIRSPEAAKQAVNAAAAGMLVISTFHAPDLQGGIRRFQSFCGEDKELFASQLLGAFYLRLQSSKERENTQDPYKNELMPGKIVIPDYELLVDPLLLTFKSETNNTIRASLKTQELMGLASIVEQQKRFLIYNATGDNGQ